MLSVMKLACGNRARLKKSEGVYRTQYEPISTKSAAGGWRSEVPWSARFMERLTGDRRLLTGFERSEATDLLKRKDGALGRTQYEPIFYQSPVGSWQSDSQEVQYERISSF